MPFLHGYGMTVTIANTWPLSQLEAPSHRMQADLHTGRLASPLMANLEAAASSPTITAIRSPRSDTTLSGQRQNKHRNIHSKWRFYLNTPMNGYNAWFYRGRRTFWRLSRQSGMSVEDSGMFTRDGGWTVLMLDRWLRRRFRIKCR